MRLFNQLNIIFFVLLVERTTSFLSSSDYQKSQIFICSSRTRAIVRHLGENSNEGDNNDVFGGIKSFFKELDNFIDDAFSRRLGNGSAFYGKRKSNFYGEQDKNKKQSDGFNPQGKK